MRHSISLRLISIFAIIALAITMRAKAADQPTPLMSLLPRFTSPSVPELGPAEITSEIKPNCERRRNEQTGNDGA